MKIYLDSDFDTYYWTEEDKLVIYLDSYGLINAPEVIEVEGWEKEPFRMKLVEVRYHVDAEYIRTYDE